MPTGPTVQAAWSRRLVVTLKRGLAGKRTDQRATAAALGLRRREAVVEVPNNPSIRGMLDKIKRLVAVETKEMHEERLAAERLRREWRPPFVVRHEVEQRS
eukprot:TRINITY_DN36473_c0_g1_i1.p1 TRINITY_DN36473_c0_g1~~TRINITY_DN36473_c0_g1_i1.p1  ORF type:complete len:101 (-),score=0.80 TRINITY_DN36473_c0_g1_i1:189-491(-)